MERLQKVLASQGVASRRKIEALIESGQIKVNNTTAHLGMKVNKDDKIYVNDKLIKLKNSEPQFLIYHKPCMEICSTVSHGLPTVYDQLPSGNWYGMGRLDVNTSGLYIFSNTSSLVNLLTHPKYGHKRVYLAKLQSLLTSEQLSNIVAGISYQGQTYKASKIKLHRNLGKNAWYKITLKTGKYHEVKQIFAAMNANVIKLKRIEFGPFTLPVDLPKGAYMKISAVKAKEYVNLLMPD